MAVKLKVSDLLAMNNSGALGRLMNVRTFSTKTNYQVARLMKALRPEFATTGETHKAVLDKYKAVQNLNAKPGEKSVTFPTDEDEKAADKEFAEFLATEIEIEAQPVEIPGDVVTGLSPADVGVLHPLLADKE